MTYGYLAYRLNFQSDILLPELGDWPCNNGSQGTQPNADIVHIRLGAVPETLAEPTGQGVLYQAGVNQFLLKLDHVARYLVQNGNEITIQPAPGALASDIRVFLLGSALGALLHQRELLVLHASAIWTDAGAVLFCGPSGIGKSTLLGELLRRGHPMMVDDVCAVVLDNQGTPIVLPGYPRTRLWADSAKVLAVETAGLERTRPMLEKFERQLPDQFCDQPTPLHRIYRLMSTNKDALTLQPLPRIETFNAVLHNTYRHAFLDGLAMRQSHFKLVSSVATRVGVTTVVRPIRGFKLTELADCIEADLGER